MITNFHNKRILKEKPPCKSLSIIMLDSAIKAKKKVLFSNNFRRI